LDEKTLDKTDQELFDKYCFKRKYKDKCDPFCVAAFTGTCEYLKKKQKDS